MSNKTDEAFYNTLESPHRYPMAQRNITAGDSTIINDYDYTNVNDSSYQKLNPANEVTKNMYSSLVNNGSSNGKAQIPQDYLTPVVISENLKEHCKLSSNTTSPVIVKDKKKSKKERRTCLYLLLLLTCLSLLMATTAVILAVVALSEATSAANNGSIEVSPSEEPTTTVVNVEEVIQNDNISAVNVDKKLSELYINITTQLNTLMDFISHMDSTSSSLRDEVELMKGV